jgi:CDP-glycerol glycerophosphotransferase (TagB/SpsB family)
MMKTQTSHVLASKKSSLYCLSSRHEMLKISNYLFFNVLKKYLAEYGWDNYEIIRVTEQESNTEICQVSKRQTS